MQDFSIVDCHVHFYDPTRLSYPWLDGVPDINRTHLPSDYSAATAAFAVEKMVFVEVDAAEEQRFQEAVFANGLIDNEPRLRGIVASALIERGLGVRQEIEQLQSTCLVRGIRRQIQNRNEPGWCLQPAFLDGMSVLADQGLPFDLCIKSHQLRDATELVRRCPGATFVLDHIAKPLIASGLRDPWWEDIKAMAALPNVVCKIAGVTTEANHAAWTLADIQIYIDHAIDCFGLTRCLFASDWPVMNLSDSFAGWIDTLDKILAGVSASERRGVYHDHAICVYRL